MVDYFPFYRCRDLVLDPLLVTERLGMFKIEISVHGGGIFGATNDESSTAPYCCCCCC
jgi:ribosomal protein S9